MSNILSLQHCQGVASVRLLKTIALQMQVLGGAGPAIAAVPLTVVWAGGSFVTLASGLGAGKVGPIGAVQRVGYVFFMSVAQVSWPLPSLLKLKPDRSHHSLPAPW